MFEEQLDLIRSDIEKFLHEYQKKELLRFLTCGSVDDGKSTLIGRLLYDTGSVYQDQLEEIERESKRRGFDQIDLSLLVDGLEAERQQGITIDVAYRYFYTSKRKFIIADAPGHEQYTRNMVTGASNSDLAVILIDARKGVLPQTRRHSYIASLLGIKHIVVAVNKMDLVDWSRARFEEICAVYEEEVASKLNIADLRFIPLSALTGDNVVHPSRNMPWFGGMTLLETLETVDIVRDRNLEDIRFPIQFTSRPNSDFRGFCGTITAGILRPGEEITVLPSGQKSRIQKIVTFDGKLEEAFPPMAVTVTLEDEIDVSRGDLLCGGKQLPHVADRCYAMIVWMGEKPLFPGRQYDIKHGSLRTVSGSVGRILHRVDINTLTEVPAKKLELNEIGLCEVAFSAPLPFDSYEKCKGTGAFILIDRLTNATVGAGMIVGPVEGICTRPVTAEERAIRFGQRPVVVDLYGQMAFELACQLERHLFDTGHAAALLDTRLAPEVQREIIKTLLRSGLVVLRPALERSPLPESKITIDADKTSPRQAFETLRKEGVLLS